MSTNDMSRRGFMTAAAGTATAAAAAGTAAAQTQVPEFSGYLSEANLYSEDGVQDARGQEELTISVGAGDNGLAFDPATVWISPGTTITWEWTGEGGAHNVNTNEGEAELDSGSPVAEGGTTYEYEFTEEDAGITEYRCIPHEPQGMRGGIAVGDDVPTIEVGGSQGPAIIIPDSALALTVATFIGLGTTLGLGYFFMKYGGDYEE
ncbi:halocyanin domain-containing protein [Natronomonas sp. CBA1123]|jgi:halocyanin-like protein|uniref:halocyanin domain-containing protein n=1 Tax=Natronomonas sp. CBA1123 TaxID=2668070 RepID=UPI0012EA6180|nr:halocyanin domain-containing protein [Natronomonas sp. CBA1123]MUV88033.1 halocyanin domain-containing protein [Natronomonas sp. CBA1123]